MRARPVVRRSPAAAVRAVAVCVTLLTAVAHPAVASRQTASVPARTVTGVVVDASGATIPGAVVQLTSPAGERSTVTDLDGRFEFPQVLPVSSRLSVTFDGFAPLSLPVPAGAGVVRLVLHPLPLTESVTVRGALPRVASAARTGTPVREVPQSITILTRQLLADQAMRSMADVVNYVPGVGMAQGEGHRDAPIFRGNTSTSDFFVDGLRDDTQYLRDLYNVERVEVLKGPNGMLFGRGGAGGVINRVTRQADWTPSQEVTVQAGAWDQHRVSADLGRVIGRRAAVRTTGMFENSHSFRAGVGLERFGINPTVALSLGPRTTFRAGYELFRDERTTDRGMPSFAGRPLDIDPSTFFGSTTINTTDVTVNAVSASLAHEFRNGVTLRNQLRYADYDKFYQNLVPGSVNAAQSSVTLSGYNNRTERQNVFNQTDLVIARRTGRFQHTLLAGVEVGRQVTDNQRMTAYFPAIGPAATSISVPLSNPTTTAPVEFRAAASDANNHGVATMAAVYVQDDIALSRRLHTIVGLRYDQFAVDLLDQRTKTLFATDDGLLSPRLGVVYKPLTPLSLYASYTRSHLPRAGEQLASLSLTNQALAPENFRNYEVGAKWEVAPALAFTTAVYRLDHGNVFVRDAFNPAVAHLVDAERTKGVEVELSGRVTGRWSVQGGYAFQDGVITQALSASVPAGARLAQVPRHSFSMWNRYDVSRRWGAGLGVIRRADSFVATDNSVVLPGFTRVDAAVFLTLNSRLRAHINFENLLNERYYWSAHNNNNISPGSPRALRVSLATQF